MSPGELHYEEPNYTYPTVEDAWSRDWENIGKDFRIAVNRFEKEHVV